MFSLFRSHLCFPLPWLYSQASFLLMVGKTSTRFICFRFICPRACNPKGKGSMRLKSRNVSVRIPIFSVWVTCCLLNQSYKPSTSLDISILSPLESTWNRFLIGKRGSVSGKKGCDGLPHFSTKEGPVAL